MMSATAKQKPEWQKLYESRAGSRMFDSSNIDYRICTQCIMDSTDPEIRFDENGVCHHCHEYDRRVADEIFKGEEGRERLSRIIQQIKDEGTGKPYDCIIGLSGGVDSTYVAYLCKRIYGLRPLAVHLDNGWNSEISVRNIENIVNILDIDLYTEVLDWDMFRRLQLSFLRASTPDSEIPTDHAIVSTLYNQAKEYNIRWIMDGSNVATEIMVPETWSHGHMDWKYIKSVSKLFDPQNSLKKYPHYDHLQYRLTYPILRRLVRFPILNYVDFNKKEAMEIMKRELKWEPYGGKHYESIYTRFYQGYILPTKFGFDKRRPHLSCLIKNGQITRDEALALIQQPALSEEIISQDKLYVSKKLGLSEDEFNDIMSLPRKTFWDYPSYELVTRISPFWRVGTYGYKTLKKAKCAVVRFYKNFTG